MSREDSIPRLTFLTGPFWLGVAFLAFGAMLAGDARDWAWSRPRAQLDPVVAREYELFSLAGLEFSSTT
jgi:hypothetical protein